jgi:hypothetical protein
MAEVETEREYRYGWPWALVTLNVVFMLVLACCAFGAQLRPATLRDGLWLLAGVVAFIRILGWLVTIALFARYGWVRTTSEGLMASDGLERTASVRWPAVTLLHVNDPWANGPMYTTLRLGVGDGPLIRLGPYLRDMPDLTQEIIERADLVQVEKTWYGTVSYGHLPGR